MHDFEFCITQNEVVFDAADVMRLGRDVLVEESMTTNRLGIHWLKRHLDRVGFAFIRCISRSISFPLISIARSCRCARDWYSRIRIAPSNGQDRACSSTTGGNSSTRAPSIRVE